MGTSRSGSVGSSPRWRKTRNDLVDLANAMASLVGPGRSIPLDAKPTDDKSGSSPGGGGGGGGGGVVGMPGGGAVPGRHARSAIDDEVRALGRGLIKAHRADPRFLPLLGDCAVRVALEELFALSRAATLKYRTQSDAPRLFAEYGVNMGKSVAIGLSRALDDRFRKQLVDKCGEITDNAEKARLAMQQTLLEMLAKNGSPDDALKMSAAQIHDALRKTNAMDIARQFYKNYIFSVVEFLISSSHADITLVAEQAVLHQMRMTYCEEVADRLVRLARSKGWRAGEIPDRVEEWRDLLVEEEAAHV